MQCFRHHDTDMPAGDGNHTRCSRARVLTHLLNIADAADDDDDNINNTRSSSEG